MNSSGDAVIGEEDIKTSSITNLANLRKKEIAANVRLRRPQRVKAVASNAYVKGEERMEEKGLRLLSKITQVVLAAENHL